MILSGCLPWLLKPIENTKLAARKAAQQTGNGEPSISALSNNQWLFNCGVVLIELGHNAPFEEVRDAEGLQVGLSSQFTDFIAARRVGKTIHEKLNMTYGLLVEKCLNCDFGVATDLEEIELQNAVVVHVVNQLDTCLEQYRVFNSLAPSLSAV